MIKSFAQRNMVLTIAAVMVMCLTLTSCESLRKKFTRQKKKKDTLDFIPVLEPQEYPAPENDPVKNYDHHYNMIKAWYKDLETYLEEEGTEKRQIYTLNQIFNHISEMQKVVVAEKSAQLTQLADQLSFYRKSLERPLMQRNITRIQSDLRAFDRMLRQLNADKIEGSFVSVNP